MIMIDANNLQALMTIVVLSSLITVVFSLFSLWFLSKWAEIKELTLKLLKQIDENYVEQKSEKLKAVYVKQAFTEEATLNYETTKEPQTTQAQPVLYPVFEEDLPKTTNTTTTKKPSTTEDIKELIKKRKTKNPAE